MFWRNRRPKFRTKMYGIRGYYVAFETRCTAPGRVSQAWIKEVAKPYRTGHGWRVRLGHFAVQFGRCQPNPDVAESEDAFLRYMEVRYIPYLGEPQDDAPGEGSDQGAGDDEVRVAEPEPVLGDSVVVGRDLPDVRPVRVGGRTPGGQEDGPQEDLPAADVRRGDAGHDRPTEAAQDRPGG